MESSQILIVGIGGLGCTWASRAHARGGGASLLMIDADESFPHTDDGHIMRLGRTLDQLGCTALPPLAEQRMRGLASRTRPFLETAELVILVTGLGGGTGTGASHEFARQAKLHGATVLSIAALPFSQQPTRLKIATTELQRLEHHSDVCVQLSLERLARQARTRGKDWSMGSEWVEDLVDGLVRTLLSMGLINLDLMDLRAIVRQPGASTMLVGSGHHDNLNELFEATIKAPLAPMNVGGAKGCLLQIEGGIGMTIGQVDEIATALTSAVDSEAQVILGARVTPELEGVIRVVMLLSGISDD